MNECKLYNMLLSDLANHASDGLFKYTLESFFKEDDIDEYYILKKD